MHYMFYAAAQQHSVFEEHIETRDNQEHKWLNYWAGNPSDTTNY